MVGCAVAHALARRGVASVVLEAQPGLALGASGANSGILHTGFDSRPGHLETELILRSAQLRERLLAELGVPAWRCGALLAPRGENEREAVRALAASAAVNGVQASLRADGSLEVPGETVTDPVAYVHALAGAARAGGATVRLRARVVGLAAGHASAGAVAGGAGSTSSAGVGNAGGARRRGAGVTVSLAHGERVTVRGAVNCAGLYADEVARLAGDELVEVYPRKGEFLAFAMPAEPLEQILLPVPSKMGKGVLVFPTVDRRAVIAGPTARERRDKEDWSVEQDARELIVAKAARALPALAGAQPLGCYAGLRPAGRDANYVIERSRTLPGVVHVAAIRSTGLSASLAIGELVARMLAQDGVVELGEPRALPTPALPASALPWWRRAGER